MKEFDYIVVGGGCIGVAAAYHLAKLKPDASVALLEKGKFLGQGSTGKCAGGVRAQFSTRINSQLSLLSLEQFEHFEEETGHPLQFLQWGYLFLLTNDQQLKDFRQYHEVWTELGMEVEWLEPSQIQKRYSYVETQGIQAATFHQRDGFADPNDIVQGYASAARKRGVQEFTECEVLEFGCDQSNRSIQTLKTHCGEFAVKEKVVLATGAWTGKLCRQLRVEVPIEPYRRQILVTKPFDKIKTPFPMTVDMGSGLYFHPESGGVLIGLSDHAEPASFNETLNEDFVETMLMAAMERAPLLEEAAINRGWAGLYEITPDHHPVFDWLGPIENCYVCAGFSGHGLMHAPAAGLLVAEKVVESRSSSLDISALSLERFHNPELLQAEKNVI